MKICVILLNCNRSDLTLRVIKQNFYNSGYDALTYLIDNGSTEQEFTRVATAYHYSDIHRFESNQGIAKAINQGINYSKQHNCDGIVTLANDILMPENWLKDMVEAAKAIPQTGMCGIHCVESLPEVSEINGIKIHKADASFGNVLIPMKAVNKIGYFNEDYDPYGMQDSDYAYRLKLAGFINYYIQGKSEHIGHDVGNGSEYRKMKDEGLRTVDEKWKKWTAIYNSGNYTINEQQYYGEPTD